MFKLKSLLNEQQPETITIIDEFDDLIDFSGVKFAPGDWRVPPGNARLAEIATKIATVLNDPKNENVKIVATFNAGADKGAMVQKFVDQYWKGADGWHGKQYAKFKGWKEDPNVSNNQSQESRDNDNRILATGRAYALFYELRAAVVAQGIDKKRIVAKKGNIEINQPRRYANAKIEISGQTRDTRTTNRFHCAWEVSDTLGGQALATQGSMQQDNGDGTISNTGNYCRWWQLEGFSENIPGDTVTITSNPKVFPDAFMIQTGNEIFYSGFAGKAYHKDKTRKRNDIANAIYSPAKEAGQFPYKAQSKGGRYFSFELYWMIENEDLVGKFDAVMSANNISYAFSPEKILPGFSSVKQEHLRILGELNNTPSNRTNKREELLTEWRRLWKNVELASAGRSTQGKTLSTRQKEVEVKVVIFAPLVRTEYNLKAKCSA